MCPSPRACAALKWKPGRLLPGQSIVVSVSTLTVVVSLRGSLIPSLPGLGVGHASLCHQTRPADAYRVAERTLHPAIPGEREAGADRTSAAQSAVPKDRP